MKNTELSLDQLQQISGGGWFDNLLSAEEVVDYWVDKLFGGTADNIKSSIDKVNDLDTGVYQPPGSDKPGPGVFHWSIGRSVALAPSPAGFFIA